MGRDDGSENGNDGDVNRNDESANGDDRDGVREAFSLLGHEIRLDILLALLEDWHAVYTEPKSYAELMGAVGLRDSGQFNYHLDKLRGVYVRKLEDGYVPTASVTALYRTVLAHRPTEHLEYGPAAIDSACPRCDQAPVVRYDRGFATVDCAACEWTGFTYPFPKNGLEGRDADAIADAVTRRAGRDIDLARTGQCPFCAGTTTVDLRLEALRDEGDDEDADGDRIAAEVDGHWVEIVCDDCTFLVGVDPLGALLADGRVVGALAEAGLEPDRYDWEQPTPTARVESRDPARLGLEVELEDEDGIVRTATIVVDDTFAVRSLAVDP
ncbi:helix-turn-helix transcriptional regulator [Halostagnicola sp. A56]|uniref:DUF7351 domain-containing protein n=1 Tax=Halostagnicola sp. A56 TaxID=1495067 RepID=UPI00049F5F98|nr:helix-turn-helix transcriptional regulator [Halostagnicola sp. A56]